MDKSKNEEVTQETAKPAVVRLHPESDVILAVHGTRPRIYEGILRYIRRS